MKTIVIAVTATREKIGRRRGRNAADEVGEDGHSIGGLERASAKRVRDEANCPGAITDLRQSIRNPGEARDSALQKNA